MAEIRRQSPVQFKVNPLETEVRGNWTVALAYSDEGGGPWLVDLSHKTRWDLQDSKVGEQTPCDLTVPEDAWAQYPGRQGAGQPHERAPRPPSITWAPEAPVLPDFPGYTDVSEATLFRGSCSVPRPSRWPKS